ncbi:MAG: hypothetical protein KGQ77_05690, partial [Betaproteobacteria bacterium]|nr:hypothetical protein [Betaproteobacteria bacterium]
MGEDIDVFTGAAGGSAGAPRVMILVDNSNNWVQDQPNGKSKFLALAAVMNSITTPVKVGLSMFTKGAPTGGYIRFAPRDMSVSSNRTAFQSLLGGISADANVGTEAGAPKDESAALYEIYKYYSSAAPRSGKLVQNPNADSAGNMGSYAGATAAAQGLTSGFAFDKEGDYVSDTSACSKAYIIYIVANNSSGGPTGQRIYEGVDSGAPVLPAPGAPDTFADEWARFLYTHRDPQVTTYVMDAYYPDDNQDAGYSLALQSIAKQGGGSYKHVRNQAEITTELLRIFAEIKAINSTFASASLPISAANRAQNKNQVFFGMFRPDAEAKPRWFGNLKQYQLINQAGVIELADVTGALAINNNTGFIADCSTSFWTSDSGTYWQNVPVNPSVAGTCTTTSFGKFSDAPDGPFVEKGGTAEVVRKGNAPAVTNSTPTFIVNRSLYT